MRIGPFSIETTITNATAPTGFVIFFAHLIYKGVPDCIAPGESKPSAAHHGEGGGGGQQAGHRGEGTGGHQAGHLGGGGGGHQAGSQLPGGVSGIRPTSGWV